MTSVSLEWQDATDSKDQPTREFHLQREGKRLLTGAVWLPETVADNVPLVCFGHGGSGDRYQQPISTMASKFLAQGIPCLAIDGPVHGLRGLKEGHPQANFQKHYVQPDSMELMRDDWQAAVETVLALPEVGPRSLAYWGLSMGTMFGLPFIADRNDVLVACLGLAGADTDKFPHGAELLDLASQLTCPTFFLMQWDDEIINRERYLNLFDALGSNNKRMHANPGKHAEVAKDEIAFMVDFMLGHIQGRLAERQVSNISS
ncbi:hypothetical protein R50073_18960 [Maricurvus nonylphenolicus]|uniref:alpha/beta hydrolase n=1 Tax=Maricurvus nonylphenolicus TaxID=1008307 RepID=UPI0036F23AE9